MDKRPAYVAEQFDEMSQQAEADTLGIWTFLATEILFFGGLFMGYIVYRMCYPDAFIEGSRHSNLALGTINTAVLLTSSLTMALAVHAAEEGRTKMLIKYLTFTMMLGTVFLGIKAVEYHEHIVEHLIPGKQFPPDLPVKSQLFFYFYWVMTGLHAVHLIIGIAVMACITTMAKRNRFSNEYFLPVEISGLYWHFIDIVWVFLYPMFYLVK